MSEELTERRELFHVKLQSDTEQQPTGDPGKSLIREIEKLQAEVGALRTNVQSLCQAVRGLVTLQAVMDKRLDVALNFEERGAR